jgi:hypothetical protein
MGLSTAASQADLSLALSALLMNQFGSVRLRRSPQDFEVYVRRRTPPQLVRSYSGNEIRCRGKEPTNQFYAHPLPEAVSGAAAAPLGAVGRTLASAARILVSFW